MLSYNDIFKGKKKILFVVAHPDDIDVFYAGIVALLRKNNVDCSFLILTSGDMGGKGVDNGGLAKKREAEQLSSLKIVGVPEKNVEFAHLKDGFLENDHKTISIVVRAIRRWKPEMVCSFDPRTLLVGAKGLDKYISHRDHRNCGQVAIDAVYPYARIDSYCSEYGPGYTVREMLLADPSSQNTAVDISGVIEVKREMLSCHKSQWDKEVVEEILNDDEKARNVFVEDFGYFKLAW